MALSPPYPLVKIKGKYLHSPYNPVKEAEKVLARECYKDKTSLIIFEPGVGYGVEILLSRYPHLRFFIISPLNKLDDRLKEDRRVTYWTGNLGEGLESFLSENIHESDLPSLAYLPWPASLRLLPEEAAQTGACLSRFLQRLRANHSHVTGFGRTNFRNSLINYLSCAPPRLPDLKGVPVLLAASGPSLETNREEIRRKREGYFIISLPSAVLALQEGGIKADLILSTDPGYWASRHFRYFPGPIPVGTGLNGRACYERGESIFPLFNQGTYGERALLGNWPLPLVPSTGSVALSALEFVKRSGASSLTFVGLDLAMRDIKSHTSPHSFDNFLLCGTSRFRSLHQVYYERVRAMTASRKGPLRFGHALEQYKSWLETHSQGIDLYRLNSGTPPLTGVDEISSLPSHPPCGVQWNTFSLPPRKERLSTLTDFLSTGAEQAKQTLNRKELFLRNDSFGDFLYTLIPEEYTALKGALLLDREVSENRERAQKRVASLFKQWEDLCDRLS
ncbi:MAG: DUF115 domain-containing protein [Spirochaetales bacterium]|nr:DUF115 domain-containing protein [Spirochaetales bacterium]